MSAIHGNLEPSNGFEQPEYEGRGLRSMLMGLACGLVLLALAWLLYSSAGSLMSANAHGMTGWRNFFFSSFLLLGCFACLGGGVFAFILGTNAWGRDRVRSVRAAQGEVDEQPQQTDPVILIGAGGVVFFFGVQQSHEVVVMTSVAVAFILGLFGLVRIALNVIAPKSGQR